MSIKGERYHAKDPELEGILERIHSSLAFRLGPLERFHIELTCVIVERAERALDDHASALVRAAEASDKHTRGLGMATWALVAATAALVLQPFILTWLGR